MKKLLILLFMAGTLAGCKKDNNTSYPVEQVFKDPQGLLDELKAALDNGSSGWKATLNPKAGKSYGLFILTDRSGGINMLADLNPQTAVGATVGTYNLRIASGNAILHFSSGTYLDQIRSAMGNTTITADTSYAYQYSREDTLMLLGTHYGDELKLVRTTAEELVDYNNGALSQSLVYASQFFGDKPFYSVITPDKAAVMFTINQANRSAILSFVSNGRLVSTASDFSYGIDRIYFKTPLQMGDQRVDELLFDKATNEFYIDGGLSKLSLMGTSMPVIPLHLMLGTEFPGVLALPSPYYIQQLPGWSDKFFNSWYEATLDLQAGEFQSLLLDVELNLNIRKEQMNLEIYFQQGQSVFQAIFPYTYTKTPDGVFSFKALPLDPSDNAQGNAALIQPYVQPVLDVLANNKLTVDYLQTDAGIIAQFNSPDDPDMYFTSFIGSIAN